MGIRTRYNDRANQMTLGEFMTHGAGMFGGEIAGIAVGATVIIDSLDNASEYDPLQDKIVALHRDNLQIRGVIDNDVLKGYKGQASAEGFLSQKAAANKAKIVALQKQQPDQLSEGEAVGIVAGMGLVGVVAGAAIAHAAWKATARFRRQEGAPRSIPLHRICCLEF